MALSCSSPTPPFSSPQMASQNGLFLVLVVLLVSVSGFEFDVGDKMGWHKPTGKEPETYNEWAAGNRFHVGDKLVFKYQNDSVLLVNSADYLNCTTTNPISKFEDGNTVFQLDRPGYFFFISGKNSHCKSGERLILDVIHPHEEAAPELAPSPVPGGWSSGGGESDEPGPSEVSSASEIPPLFSCSVATLVAGVSYMFV